MDGLSAIAGIAIAGVQLSKALYDLYSTVSASHREIQDVANNVSLLAMVLEELDGVLCGDGNNFTPQLRDAAQSIALRCACIFEDIQKQTGADPNLKGKKAHEKIAWYFRRDRVRPLRSSLESLKSTLSILLHVVQLAKSTKGVEEYPGVKPIGQWYVRKERRGLVCLVIDNRHAVERLKHLEDQNLQSDLISTENEQPLAFADIFPLSASNHNRGRSPERKFVVAFRNPPPRNNCDSQRSQLTDLDHTLAGPSTPCSDKFLGPPSPGEHRSHIGLLSESDPESIGRSVISQSTGKSRARDRPTREPATSRLILDVIPHEEADEAFKSAQNMSRSTLLEVKAEETIDMLMRRWTYIDPEYFSADDCSSISPTESPLPLLQEETPRRTREEKNRDSAVRSSSPFEKSTKRRSGLLQKGGSAREPDKSKIVLGGDNSRPSSILPVGPNGNAKKRPGSLLPTTKYPGGDRGAKTTSLPGTTCDQGVQSPQEPSTPAPPYLSNDSGHCPSCYTVSDSASTSCVGRHHCQPTFGRSRDTEKEMETDPSIGSAINLLEKRLLEMMEQGIQDMQSRQLTEPREACQQATMTGQEADPVIMKDCLGRKFLFPIQKCRSWQSMENLIRCSFSHIEPMKSKIFMGSYDILSPTGEIILPAIWDAVIRPGWVVELRFWDFEQAGDVSQKDADAGATEMTPPTKSSPATSGSHESSHLQSETAKRRASMRTWLGSRRSTIGVALE